MSGTLVLGAGGLLGHAFVDRFGAGAVATAGRADLVGRDMDAIRRLVGDASPVLVVNCAAHTDADAAERDPEAAYAANETLPALLAAACREAGALLVQLSSTGCYGAWKDTPYSEQDPVHPTTVHHKSKVAGEEAVRASGCDYLIVRTGWLFGGPVTAPRNFVWKRLLEAAATERLASDTAQRGCPTDVADVSRQVLEAVKAGVRGTINVVAGGHVTRFGYVSRIVAASGLACEIVPAPAFERLAPVTPNETAVNARLLALGLDTMPTWEKAVEDYVAALKASPHWNDLRECRA